MPVKEYFKVAIPDGYRIFEKEFEIAGISFKKNNFIKIMKNKVQIAFELVPEPNNPKDVNAIQIVGSRKGFFGQVSKPLGYVPAAISSYVADSKLLEELMVRPKRLYVSDNGYIEFIFDILGPKELYEKYKSV